MDIIKTYLDNMFAGLPKTQEVLKMKADLLATMEEKYAFLKSNGKTENEAIGIVISEFGNIEELALELGINIKSEVKDSIPTVTKDIAIKFMDTSWKMGKVIAFGVFLCILSPITLILLNGNINDLDITNGARTFIGLAVLFILVAIAVGMFIYGGMNLEKYEYLKREVYIPEEVKEFVKTKKEVYDPKFTIALIVGIILYILSPTALFATGLFEGDPFENYSGSIGVGILLFMVAIATLIIVTFSFVKGSHDVLLRLEDYKNVDKKSEKLINAIAGVYWPFVVAGFLYWSFTSNNWGLTWIVFPIAGVIFGGISSFIRILKKD